MKNSKQHAVTVVLDPAYGDRIGRLIEYGPLWIVETADNSRAWNAWGPFAQNSALFTVRDPEARLENSLGALPDVLDHFGDASFADMPYRRCNVIGIIASNDVEQALAKSKIMIVEKYDEGFACVLPGDVDLMAL